VGNRLNCSNLAAYLTEKSKRSSHERAIRLLAKTTKVWSLLI
jgi:hypothetical protein